MTTTTQKTTLAIAAAFVVIAVFGYVMLASPVAAQTATNTTSSSTSPQTMGQQRGSMMTPRSRGGPSQQGWLNQNGARAREFERSQVNVSVGQTFTITSTQGRYFVPGSSGNNGTASGTVTFTVTGKLSEGYTLSLTGGSITVAGTTYTISSGTAQMNRGASGITGQGVTNPTGDFLLRATAHGTFVGSTGLVSIDLQSGSSEYLVILAGNIQS